MTMRSGARYDDQDISNEILVKELCLGTPHLTNEKHEHRSVSQEHDFRFSVGT